MLTEMSLINLLILRREQLIPHLGANRPEGTGLFLILSGQASVRRPDGI